MIKNKTTYNKIIFNFSGEIMDNKTISVELTEEQYKKYQIMQENDLSVGEAIDLIFKLRDQFQVSSNELLEIRVAELENKKKNLSQEMDEIDNELGILGKIADTALNPQQKQQIFEKEYVPSKDSYEMKVLAKKQKIVWGKDFFKF